MSHSGERITLKKLFYKVVKRTYSVVNRGVKKTSAYYWLNKSINRKHSDLYPIRVGFIAQMPEVWDKQMGLFQYMIADPRFLPQIIYINHYDFVNKRISEDDNQDKAFYESLYGQDAVIDYYQEKDNFAIGDYDYVFCDRPYNCYLPKELRSFNLVKKTKLCMISYCDEDWETAFQYMDFGRDTLFWFASNQYEYEAHQKAFRNRKIMI